jgi:pimeloyl-ACP methyl ester carboxylesterase
MSFRAKFKREEPVGDVSRVFNAVHEPDRHGWLRCLSTSGFHRVAYTDWGPQTAPGTVVCVHGLTRQGRDFDYLARSLASTGYRVICPDLVGRGRSGWLPHVLDYVFPQYCADMAALLATLGAAKVHWVGTSLGGLIGMVLASMPDSPVAKLVVNDIGPNVPTSAAMRVGLRVSSFPTTFASLEEAERFNRQAFEACGNLSDEQWRHFTVHGLREDRERGGYVALLDPKVSSAYHWLFYYQMTLWNYWDRIETPILAVHGEHSDFAPPSLIRAMKRAAPQLKTHLVAGAGHMPMLMSGEEIGVIQEFLQA